jgi:hypothetical protein
VYFFIFLVCIWYRLASLVILTPICFYVSNPLIILLLPSLVVLRNSEKLYLKFTFSSLSVLHSLTRCNVLTAYVYFFKLISFAQPYKMQRSYCICLLFQAYHFCTALQDATFLLHMFTFLSLSVLHSLTRCNVLTAYVFGVDDLYSLARLSVNGSFKKKGPKRS